MWKPIETAPKDGTEILVHAKDRPIGKSMTVAFWVSHGWAFLESPLGVLYLGDDITHWMPLPESPEEK